MWKTIPVDNNYEANENGQIREIKTKKYLSQWLDKDGYLLVTLSNKLYRAHRLIALTFIDNPNNYPVVNHKNFIKDDNKIENLEWVTYSQNSEHSFTNNHRKKTTKEWVQKVQHLAAEKSKTKVCQYDKNLNLIKIYDSQKQASEETGTNRTSITACVNNRRKTVGGFIWKYYMEGSTTKDDKNLESLEQSTVKGKDIV